jgi:hypothetical protein
MMVAIHQPNFLPWLGFFYKMARADKFVYLDSVPLADRSYTSRVKIKTRGGPEWLTVPVTKESRQLPIVTALCADGADWRQKVLAKIEANYRSCPHYEWCSVELEEILVASGNNLAETNIRLIEAIARRLGIHTPTVRSSTLANPGNLGDDVNIALCKTLGADTYFSGRGAVVYQNEAGFVAAGVRLAYTDFQHPTYPQLFGPFEAGLSAIDLLFNVGPDSASVMGL